MTAIPDVPVLIVLPGSRRLAPLDRPIGIGDAIPLDRGAVLTATASGRGIDADDGAAFRLPPGRMRAPRCTRGDRTYNAAVPDAETALLAAVPAILAAHYRFRRYRGEARDTLRAALLAPAAQTKLRDAFAVVFADTTASVAFDRLARLYSGERERKGNPADRSPLAHRYVEAEDVTDAIALCWQAEAHESLPVLADALVTRRRHEPQPPAAPLALPFAFIRRTARRLAARAGRAPRHATLDTVHALAQPAPADVDAVIDYLRVFAPSTVAAAVAKRTAPRDYKRAAPRDPANHRPYRHPWALTSTERDALSTHAELVTAAVRRFAR